MLSIHDIGSLFYVLTIILSVFILTEQHIFDNISTFANFSRHKRSSFGSSLYELETYGQSSHNHVNNNLLVQQSPSQANQPSVAFANELPVRVIFSRQYGGILPCSVKISGLSTDIPKVQWEQRDARSLDDRHFSPAGNIVGLRESRQDGSLAFIPLFFPNGGVVTSGTVEEASHQAVYRCIVSTDLGSIVSSSVHVTVAPERRDLVVRVQDGTTSTPGNDAQLRCSVNSDLWKVALWITDDGDIYQSLAQDSNEYIPIDRRHFVLSNGDLLIGSIRTSDTRRQYRCRVIHLITSQMMDSANWGRVKLSDQSSHISYRPRFNLNASLRQTLLATIDQPLDIYCSFDAQPPANLSWYFIPYGDKSQGLQVLKALNSEGYRRIITERHLRISRMGIDDLGTYVCVANNTQFELRYESDILMNSALRINITVSSFTLFPGDTLTLTCNLSNTVNFDLTRLLSGSRLIITYQWLHNGQSLLSNDDSSARKYSNRHYYKSRIEKIDSGMIKIPEVKSEDSGIYQCLIRLTGPPDFDLTLSEQQVIRVRSTPARLNSHFAEQVLVTDSELSLKCVAQGVPAPRIVWQRNGLNITDISGNFVTGLVMDSSLYRYKTSHFSMNSGIQNIPTSDERRFLVLSYLNISSIRAQDAGLFRCVAFNSAGSQLHQARISVIGPPYVHPIADVIATQGDVINIACPFSGYPIDEVYFTRSGIRLPAQIDRQTTPTIGVLHISAADASTDSGEYSCIAVGGSEGSTTRAEQHFRLTIVVPPVLSPLLFSDVLEEGMRATSVCSVVSGEPPITLQWLKDGIPLLQATGSSSASIHQHHQRPDPHIQVFNLNEFTHSLIINNITRHHEGIYSCMATTPTTFANRSAQLKVKAAPRFIIRPASQVAITGQNKPVSSIRFDCLANGNPQPVVRWKFLRPRHEQTSSDDKQHFDAVPILSSPQIHVLENGSLTVRSSDKLKYTGIYLCEASNGVGRVIEARASLAVVHAPELALKILPSQQQSDVGSTSDPELVKVSLRRDSQISFFCTGTGPLPLSVIWYKNGREINVFGGIPEPESGGASMTASGTFRVFDLSNSGSGERTANLVLKHITRSDNGHYVCQARNGHGTASKAVLLHVLEQPDPPEGLKATEVGARSVTLTWQIGFTGNLALLSQNIEYKRESAKGWHNALMVKSNSNTASVHGLSPLTSYEFRVAFTNELGTSEHSRSITLTTQMESPTVMPDAVRATPLNSRSVRLTWTVRVPSPDSTDVEIIDGFYLGYRLQGIEPAAYTYKTIPNQPLQYGRTSNFRTPSTTNSGPAAAFLIELQSSNSRFVDSKPETFKTLTPYMHQYYEHVIEGLQRNAQYLFVVQAFNEKGAGPTSVETQVKTSAHDPPSAPMARIDNVSAHEAILSWEHVSLDVDTPLLVDGYVISYRIVGGTLNDDNHKNLFNPESHLPGIAGLDNDDWQSVTVNFQAGSNLFTIRNLRCGTEYVARIEAFNEMGSGIPSELVRFSTSGGVPIAPDKRSQFVMSNITSVALNFGLWQDNGCPISGYAVRYRSRRMPTSSSRSGSSTSSVGQWVTLSTHLLPDQEALIIRDLPPGTWHDLVIVAANDAGRREAEFRFATLTELGATVEPLHAYDSRMSIGNSLSITATLFEDPMILIPTLCTIIVLLVVAATSAFLYVMRIKQDTIMAHMNEETYCRHRTPSSSGRQTTDESLSLSSYPSNCHTHKTIKNGIYEKPFGTLDPEPLYEATTHFGKSQQTLTFHQSPQHPQQRVPILQKLSSNENILEQVLSLEQNSYSSSFEALQPQMKMKTLSRQQKHQQFQHQLPVHQQGTLGIKGTPSHLYQLPNQQQQQQQQQHHKAVKQLDSETSYEDSLIEIGPPSQQSGSQANGFTANRLQQPFMSSFGPIRQSGGSELGFQTINI